MSPPTAVRERRLEWYFVCECGAKFFCQVQGVNCPRCGEVLQSRERLEPPWLAEERKGEAGTVISAKS
jgi:hypothetical protein